MDSTLLGTALKVMRRGWMPALPLLMVIFAGAATANGGARRGAVGIGDPYYPALGNGGYDVLHYTLDLQVNPQRDNLVAQTQGLE